MSLPDHQPIDTKGKVVLYYLFATWDVNPIHSVPKLEALQKKYSAQGFSVVAFSCEDPGTPDDSVAHREAVIVDLMRTTLGATFPIAWDREKKLVNVLPAGEPLFFLVDRRGIVRARYFGLQNEDEAWERDLVPLLP